MTNQLFTPWLGRQDSNLGMAESKSSRIANAPNDYSEIEPKSDPSKVNSLADVSECGRTETGTARSAEEMRELCALVAENLEKRWRASAARQQALYDGAWIGGTENRRNAITMNAAADWCAAIATVIRGIPLTVEPARSPAPPFAGCRG